MDRLRNFGFLLKDVSRRYALRFEERARGISLTLSQCKVLVRLEKNEGVSQARLAELAEIEPMTMVRILDRMEADGFLERLPDPSDRRARRLYLTVKAKPLLDDIWRMSELTRAETFVGISRSEREAFMDLLERMHRNVSALEGRPVEAAPVAAAAAKSRGAKNASRSQRSRPQ